MASIGSDWAFGPNSTQGLTNKVLIDPTLHHLEEIDACLVECEVHITGEWLEKLSPQSYDEKYVLKRNSRNWVMNKHSRLGCQAILSQELQGVVVVIPDPKPWDTP
ncbi:hypothetical protein PHJA_002351500 [Phtheirospermum japonicum]|uniref:Ferredoxin n=1 Tax=Phtheirospermum japonicum TaxID=374723 RepID=A0A830D4J6_9LAMI|nr:hypothetical protein PHJA_002351500 [Phtheirospermum japonicum]